MTARSIVAVALLLAASACSTVRTPYAAPAPDGPPALTGVIPAKVLVQIVSEADPRVNPPWIDRGERAADAVAAALAQAGFRTTRGTSFSWDARVTVGVPIRGPDLYVVVQAGHKAVDRLEVRGDAWGKPELAELGRAVADRMLRSPAIAALAGVEVPKRDAAAPPPAAPTAPASAAVAPPAPPAPAAPARKRLAVLDFRGPVSPQVLALLADQARAAAADAGRTSGTSVMTREGVAAALKEKNRPADACADAACELETARAAGADLLLTGEITAVGDARVLVMKLVEAGSASLVASRTAQGKDDLALVEAARPAAAALFQ